MASSIISSVVTGGSNSAQTVSEELNAYATDFVTQGVVGVITTGAGSTAGTGSFAVTQDSVPDLGVTVLLGQAYVSGVPSGQDAQVLRARMTSNYTSYTINSNSSGSTKYDWIYLQLNATNANNPDSAKDNVINLYTSRSTSNTADNGTPPTYGINLAVVTVANGASSITNSNISDKRTQATIGISSASAATAGWNTLGYPLTYSSNNGNKEFQVTSANNLTSILSPGMKLQVTRSVTPPTQSMAFASASSQYASVSSPAGITFTTAFTCEAWVYLQSYSGSGGSTVISRYNGTNGFSLQLGTTGQVQLGITGFVTYQTSYQSIPLNQWIHIAGTFSSGTMVIYINGTVAPSYLTGSGTSLTQAGSLQVGAANAASLFNGYISEARIWSAAQTAANIQANMAISVSGAASNLVAYFQGNGNFNDATSNANNLTASGGAIATQASNPYNAIEYAVINTVSYSNPTTTITLDTGVACTIPNQTLNTPLYSTQENPFGLTGGLGRNRTLFEVQIMSGTITATTIQQFNGLAATITVPTGGHRVEIAVVARNLYRSGGGQGGYTLWNGVVNSSTQLADSAPNTGSGTATVSSFIYDFVAPSGSNTLNIGFANASVDTGIVNPLTYRVRLID